MKIERPGDAFAPGADPEEARRRADIADKLGTRRDGLRWRPMSYEILVDNRRRDSSAPVLLKTRVYDSEVVTEWRRHPHPIPVAYHVFEVGKDGTEKTFAVEQGADAPSYHAELETAIKRREFDRRSAARALRFWQPSLADEPPDEREVDPWEEAARDEERAAAWRTGPYVRDSPAGATTWCRSCGRSRSSSPPTSRLIVRSWRTRSGRCWSACARPRRGGHELPEYRNPKGRHDRRRLV